MIYIQDHLLRHVAEKIARLEPCAFTGKIEPDDILITLCNTLDVWPRSSRPAGEPAVVRLVTPHNQNTVPHATYMETSL